jgi:hypothetical protein
MTRLVSSLLDEGLKTGRFPGVVYRDGPAGRRAALAGGPDVWEVVRAVRAVSGGGEARVKLVARETEIPERLVRLAIEFAAAFSEEVDERIRLDEEAADRLREQVRARERLLGM